MDEKKKITQAAGKMSGGTFISRITGFIRDILLAKIFGATGLTDAFFIAYRIPNLLRELFAEGSVSAGYVPVLTEYLTREGREGAEKFAGVVFAFLLSVLIIVCLLGILFAPYIAPMIAPNFTGNEEKITLTIKLIRIMFPFLLFISLAALAMGTLNSLRSFFIPAVAPALFNLGIIGSALFLAPQFSVPILAVALGVTFGGALQYGIQALALVKQGFHMKPIFSFYHPGLKKIFVLVLPVVLATGATQINVLINNIFVTYLAEGSATYLYYALRLVLLPIGIFGVAMAMAVLPSMSEHAVKGNLHALRETFSFSLRLVFFMSIPAMAGLIALSEPIVNVLFQRGEFTYEATQGTVYALLFYSSGLWAFVGLRVVRTPFYSLQDTRTPLKTAVLSVLINIILSFILKEPLKHGGLALAFAIATSVNFVVLLILLRAKLGRIDGKNIFRSFIKISIASTVMGFIGWSLIRGDLWCAQERCTLWMESGNIIEKAGALTGVIIVCIIIYFFIMYVMKSEELRYLLRIRKGRSTHKE
ncbi:MAG: murein biosynthesis integral membrane protein MurJ [Thermodesulfovibrionia bacterium]|nr:murein biosynthesis integral membrane protein MurJ [Thermodesulfovibrionia bacterium]